MTVLFFNVQGQCTLGPKLALSGQTSTVPISPHSCPFLVEHLTVFIPVIGVVLFVFVTISLLRTSFTDPGILPRATPDEAADVEKQIGKSHKSQVHISYGTDGVKALPYGASLQDMFVVELQT